MRRLRRSFFSACVSAGLRRELASADLERTKELQAQLEKVRAAVSELA